VRPRRRESPLTQPWRRGRTAYLIPGAADFPRIAGVIDRRTYSKASVASSFLAAGRYAMGATNASVYILDRYTGDIRACSAGCETLTGKPK